MITAIPPPIMRNWFFVQGCVHATFVRVIRGRGCFAIGQRYELRPLSVWLVAQADAGGVDLDQALFAEFAEGTADHHPRTSAHSFK